MTAWVICLVTALILLYYVNTHNSAPYACGICGSKTPDGHTKDCPWA